MSTLPTQQGINLICLSCFTVKLDVMPPGDVPSIVNMLCNECSTVAEVPHAVMTKRDSRDGPGETTYLQLARPDEIVERITAVHDLTLVRARASPGPLPPAATTRRGGKSPVKNVSDDDKDPVATYINKFAIPTTSPIVHGKEKFECIKLGEAGHAGHAGNRHLSRDISTYEVKSDGQTSCTHDIFTAYHMTKEFISLQLFHEKNDIVPGKGRQLAGVRFLRDVHPSDNIMITDFLGKGSYGQVFKCKIGNLVGDFAIKILRCESVVEMGPNARTVSDTRGADCVTYTECTSEGKMLIKLFINVSSSNYVEHQCSMTILTTDSSLAETTAIFRHTFIVADGSNYYLCGIMKYYPGNNMTYHFCQQVAFTNLPYAALGIVKSVARFLSAMNRANYVHGDIKSENILVPTLSTGIDKVGAINIYETFSKYAICDFSLSTTEGSGEYLIQCVEYRAPEVVARNTPWTQSADIWSLGILALEILTWGRLPIWICIEPRRTATVDAESLRRMFEALYDTDIQPRHIVGLGMIQSARRIHCTELMARWLGDNIVPKVLTTPIFCDLITLILHMLTLNPTGRPTAAKIVDAVDGLIHEYSRSPSQSKR